MRVSERGIPIGRRPAFCHLAALAVVAGIAATSSATAEGVANANAAQNGKIAFVRGAGSKGIEAMSPDGSRRRLLVPWETGTCAALPPDSWCRFSQIEWSPDGTHLAYMRGPGSASKGADDSLYVIDAAGNDERRLPGCGQPLPACGGFSWAPDSSRLVVSGGGGSLYVVSTRGAGTSRRLTRRNDSSEGDADTEPLWSPDGSRILFNRGSLYTVRPDGSGLRRLPGTGDASEATWFPDGRRIAFVSGGDKILTVGAEGTHLRLLSATTDFIEGWPPDRTRVVTETERRIPSGDNGNGGFDADLWVSNTDGTGRRRIFRQRCCIDTSPRAIWSPDGNRIAVAAGGGPDAGFYVVNADGTRLRRLVSDGIIAVREGFPLLAWQAIR